MHTESIRQCLSVIWVQSPAKGALQTIFKNLFCLPCSRFTTNDASHFFFCPFEAIYSQLSIMISIFRSFVNFKLYFSSVICA